MGDPSAMGPPQDDVKGGPAPHPPHTAVVNAANGVNGVKPCLPSASLQAAVRRAAYGGSFGDGAASG